ncbi:MAG TPA: dTDP-4-dehydrorhamnose reductase [Thermomicrobiales bacterium]|jgi:dTDP-4-dehydrorhamnose reductase|nr:dTDP-4-dehydrorhamnose reductase [Thermomicrobiales bacterium]
MSENRSDAHVPDPSRWDGQSVLVTGAAGQLGTELMALLRARGARVVGLGSRPGQGVDIAADITDADAVRQAVDESRPDVIIHGAAWTDVDGCERDPERAERVNGEGAANVAVAAREAGAYCLAVGTDFVFSGAGGAPYAEDAAPDPISHYGASKLTGERAVLAASDTFAVARTAWVWGGAGKHFPRTVLTVLRDRGGMTVVTDERGNPTHAHDLAAGLAELAARRGTGIFHLTNEGPTSRFDLARAVAAQAGFDPDLVQPVTSAEFLAKYPLPARRPADSALANTRAAGLGVILRPWPATVAEFVPGLAADLGIGAAEDGVEDATA